MSNKPVSEVILFPWEKGGWMFNYFSEGWYEGAAPDGWGKHKDMSALIQEIKKQYPSVRINRGVTGYCNECAEEYFDLETHCDCGQELSDA